MSFIMFSPQWFFGIDVALEIVFAVVTLLVALLAFKVYRLCAQNQAKLFGISFLFISLSYFIQSAINFLMISKMNESVSNLIKIRSVLMFNTVGVVSHMILMITGLTLLVFTTFRTERYRFFWLLLITSLAAIFFDVHTEQIFIMPDLLYTYFVITSLFLLFICWHQLETYCRNRDPKTLLIVLAFIFLFVGQIHFVLEVNHQLFYVIGHLLELFAYILILWNFYLVQKHGQKTRTTRDHT